MSDVKLRIISGFDPKGVQDAQAGMASASQSALQLNSANRAAAAGLAVSGASSSSLVGNLRGATGAAGALTAALGQGSGGLGVAARGAGAILGSLSAGPIGILIAGVTALVAVYQHYKNKIKEANEEVQRGVVAFQKFRIDNINEQYERLTKNISASARAQEAFADAAAKAQKSANASTIASLEADLEIRVSDATDQTDIARIRLDFERQISAVKEESDKRAAQTARDIAQERLRTEQQLLSAAEKHLAMLEKEYEKNSDRSGIGKQILAARDTIQVQKTQVNTAALTADAAASDVETISKAAEKVQAVLDNKAAAIEQSAAETAQAASEKADALKRSAAAAQEAAATDGEIAALTADQASYQRDHNKALARRAVAQGKAEAASGGGLREWIENQRTANKGKADRTKNDIETANDLRKLRDKEERGIRLSRRDRETLELSEQRRRIQEAVPQNPQKVMVEKLDIQIKELQGLRKDLKDFPPVG